MITKGAARRRRRWFARHLMNTKENDRVRVAGVYGFAHEDVNTAWRDLEAFAKDRPNCKNYFLAVSLNPEPGEVLSDAQWKQAEAIALRGHGAEGQPYMSFEHEKKGRIHRHLVISRIKLETGEVISDAFTYRKNEAISREIERTFGLNVTPSVLVKDRGTPRPERRPKDHEVLRGQQSGLDIDQVRRDVTACWQETHTGQELRQALLKSGYITCRGDRRDFVIVDPAGDDHSLPRCIAGVRAAEVRERMRGIEPASLPSVAEAKATVNKWGDNDAARAVLERHISDVLNKERAPEPRKSQRHLQRALLRQAEMAAHERSRAVKQDADESGQAGDDGALAQARSWRTATSAKPKRRAAANWHERVTRAHGELELER